MSNYNSNLQSKNIALQAILDKINNLPESDSEIVLPKLTNEGSASDLLSGKQLIDGEGNVVTGTIPTQAAKTITPSTSSQTAVASGRYTTGAVTVAGDANLKAENIAEGVSIFGVTGTHSGGGGSGGASVETCTVTITALGGTGLSFYGSGNRTLNGSVYTTYEEGFHTDNPVTLYPFVYNLIIPKNSVIISTWKFKNIGTNIETYPLSNSTAYTPTYSFYAYLIKGDSTIS